MTDEEAKREALNVHCQECGAPPGVGCWVELPDLSRPPRRVDRTPRKTPHLSRIAWALDMLRWSQANRRGG